MLTYSFESKGEDSLYEYLYKQIKNDILHFHLSPREKLPSKRALAKHLSISTITVENAYNQLIAEGYLYSVPKSGFYVADISGRKPLPSPPLFPEERRETKAGQSVLDFSSNATAKEAFPFNIWTKLMRETMSDDAEKLMVRSPSGGVDSLRRAIVTYLYQFRGMIVEPSQVIVGAGTEYLYGLLIQLLGRNNCYAFEDPGYQKINRIYRAHQVESIPIPMDSQGINVELLKKSKASVLHISPSHHFPTGIVTPISRRYEILSWASGSEDRFIIEDDYDSEFRMQGKPIPSLQSIDVLDKVIYMNTFSKSLSSTIRISYMVLPKSLMKKYQSNLDFYSCTVSNFEQYTLAKFIGDGHLEKHINRMRNYYRNQRDEILECIRSQAGFSKVEIMEEHAGLHFLLKVDTPLSDAELIKKARQCGIHISCLSQYYFDKSLAKEHILIINYSGIPKNLICDGINQLFTQLID